MRALYVTGQLSIGIIWWNVTMQAEKWQGGFLCGSVAAYFIFVAVSEILKEKK